MENHLKTLEQQSIEIIREVLTTIPNEKIICFYSMGKDSSCLLRLIEKASFPNKIPIRFLHIDTGWKFKEMYEFRNNISNKINLEIFKHPDNLNPYIHKEKYTDVDDEMESFKKLKEKLKNIS